MDKEQIVEAIRRATNGTFIGTRYGSTGLNWTPKYDCMGRPLNCDPNYIDSTVIIDEKYYFITRIGWEAIIWNQACNYTTYWKKDRDDFILARVDLTPEHVKEYYRNRGEKR